jgi:uncharacterized protein (DUF1330 family)
MPTYIVGDIHITDPTADQAHVAPALATIARFGGVVIADAGSRVDLLKANRCRNNLHHRISERRCGAAMVSVRRLKEALNVRLSASHGRVFLIEGSQISTSVPVAGLDPGKD